MAHVPLTSTPATVKKGLGARMRLPLARLELGNRGDRGVMHLHKVIYIFPITTAASTILKPTVVGEVKVGRADSLTAVITGATAVQVAMVQIVPVRKVGQETEGEEEGLVMELAVVEEAMVAQAVPEVTAQQYQ
jgi:hypothetical protein